MELNELDDQRLNSGEDTEIPDAFDNYMNGIPFSLYSKETVVEFLRKNDLRKDNVERLFAWLLNFRIIPYDSKRWGDSIRSIYNDYQILIRTNLIDEVDNPLMTLTPETQAVISADISRIINWFNDMSKILNIPEDAISKAEFHSYRVLAILTHTKPFNYAQGHDRYFFVTYLLALCFTSKAGLSSDYAEALTYHLAFALIQMGGISKYLDNPKNTQKHFEKLDVLMDELTPKRFGILRDSGQTSIYFSLRWELLIFSDEYDINDIFYLWDNVILRRRNYEKFLMYLCVAHLIQVPLPQGNEMMISNIQSFRNFAVTKAIEDAVTLMGGDREPYSLTAIGLSIAVLILCLFTIKYML